MSKDKQRKGFYLNPITFNLIFRPLASLAGGVIATGLIWLLQNLPVMISFILSFSSSADKSLLQAFSENSVAFVTSGTALIFVTIFAILIGLPDTKETETVPVSYAAVMTFWGMPFRIYRTNGDYKWRGRWLLLDRTRVKSPPFTDEAGYIFLDVAPIPIWNSSKEKDKIILSSIAKDGSTIYTNLLLNVRLFDPIRWVQTQEPLLMVAERARAGFRTAISFFTGRDNSVVKSVLRKLMVGEEILTCFLQKTVEQYKAGSMIKDHAGVAVYVRVNDYKGDEKETARQKAEKGLQKLIDDSLSEDMKNAVLGKDGQPFVESRSVEETMEDVLISVGAIITDASVGDISFSKEVEEEANKASGEEFQAIARRDSAVSTAEAQTILARAQAEEPADDLSRVVAAAQDNPDSVNIVYVPGGDTLTKAAAVVTAQNKGKDK